MRGRRCRRRAISFLARGTFVMRALKLVGTLLSVVQTAIMFFVAITAICGIVKELKSVTAGAIV